MKGMFLFSLIAIILIAGTGPRAMDQSQAKQRLFQRDYEKRRRNMVETQIRARGITDRKVLAAMAEVPRHLFVAEVYRGLAYEDGPLPIGFGQTISQPYIVAFMTESLKLSPGDRVLEVGTGSGYQAAVLAEIVKDVFTIEIIPDLGREAGKRLNEMGYENIHVRIGDGYLGWPEEAPFDAILVTAAAGEIPPALVEQLKTRGRLCIPVGESGAVQSLLLVTKDEKGIRTRTLLPVRFVPLVHPEKTGTEHR